MSYRIYSKKDASIVDSVLEFDETYVDDVTDKKKDFAVGDTVEITHEGKWKGICGVVVHAAYNMYRVEPYNDEYWNNPANICKLGLFSDNELKKIKKKPKWSTVFTGNGSVVGVSRVSAAVESPEDKEADKLRKMFSGGVRKVTEKKEPRKLSSVSKPKEL